MSTITFHYHIFISFPVVFPCFVEGALSEGSVGIVRELPWYVYYSYVHNVVVIAHRHLFANLFLSFGKTQSSRMK